MLKEIYKRLNISSELRKERERFLNRVKKIIGYAEGDIYNNVSNEEEDAFRSRIAYALGRSNVPEFTSNFISSLESESLEENLANIEVILEEIKNVDTQKVQKEKIYNNFKSGIENALGLSVIDLGYCFKNGKFYKSGAKELDEKLVLEVLDWLEDFPTAKDFFRDALEKYIKKDYKNTITNSYSALESLSKTFLNNKKNLKDNSLALIKKLNLLKEWSQILYNFCIIANEFSSRHGKKEGKEIKIHPRYVENYLYQTGVIIRLIIREIKNN